ncbi:DUF7742 family protein [Sinisalibacter aestuarii]|uniref:DUF7742 domain-containing protein n=1 Tax=Sinisalibacter aestuarii TaxID=2949426 RepID=A0ABQ5LUS5_9RHOB|nr:hypothetical protein [Sinisalibacter aestuarii]GKY88739.1 hypothetical protein STA1M1_26080 [Sinisalibacter aestuarii]
MRPVLHGDLTMAGLALLAAPPEARPMLLARMLEEADRADSYRKTTGRAHPHLGCGSLMSVAMSRPRMAEPYLDDPDYAACLGLVLQALVARAR